MENALQSFKKVSFSLNAIFIFPKCAQNNINFFCVLILGCLSYDDVNRRRNEIFDSEQKRQRDSVGRIEKIEVRYLGLPQDETMIMNKHISTPFNCAQREWP